MDCVFITCISCSHVHVFYAVDLTACSSNLVINGSTVKHGPNIKEADPMEVAFLTPPNINIERQSISVRVLRGCSGNIIVGFGYMTEFTHDYDKLDIIPSIMYSFLNGESYHAYDSNIVEVGKMSHRNDNPILTLVYDATAGTLHGAYDLEPAVLLLSKIPLTYPLIRPFVALCEIDDVIMVVPNPRQDFP